MVHPKSPPFSSRILRFVTWLVLVFIPSFSPFFVFLFKGNVFFYPRNSGRVFFAIPRRPTTFCSQQHLQYALLAISYCPTNTVRFLPPQNLPPMRGSVPQHVFLLVPLRSPPRPTSPGPFTYFIVLIARFVG